jgi:hypothetical protein
VWELFHNLQETVLSSRTFVVDYFHQGVGISIYPLAGKESYARGQARRYASERNHERDNLIKYHNQLGFTVNFTLASGEVLAAEG